MYLYRDAARLDAPAHAPHIRAMVLYRLHMRSLRPSSSPAVSEPVARIIM